MFACFDLAGRCRIHLTGQDVSKHTLKTGRVSFVDQADPISSIPLFVWFAGTDHQP